MSRPASIILLLLFMGLLGVAWTYAPARGDVDSGLYYGFTLVDPATERVLENAYVVVSDGRLAEIGTGEVPHGQFTSRRDMRGRFGLPGFVDAHAHITAGPHNVDIVDGKPLVTIESQDEITQFNARMALAFGVTTVRNPGGDPVANARYDEHIGTGTWVGPDAVHAGAVVQPPPFGGSAFAYPRTDEEWRAEARRQADLGMKYFKLYVSLSEDELATGIRVAHEHGLRAIGHLDRVSWTRAAELGIDALTHALPTSPDLLDADRRQRYLDQLGADSTFMYRWFELADLDGPLIRELIEVLAEWQTTVDLTLVVNELVYNTDDIDRVLPVADRRYTHPAVVEAGLQQLKASATGWTAEDYRRARAVMPKVLKFAKRLQEAGVPLLIGTDGSGGTPLYARELALHVAAGMPVREVLRLATSDAARRLGLGERTGRFERGMEADLVFLNANPLDDVRRVRDVDLVVSNGVAHDVAELTAVVGHAH
jgi:imidazolonepropionase-like amidohydrolase